MSKIKFICSSANTCPSTICVHRQAHEHSGSCENNCIVGTERRAAACDLISGRLTGKVTIYTLGIPKEVYAVEYINSLQKELRILKNSQRDLRRKLDKARSNDDLADLDTLGGAYDRGFKIGVKVGYKDATEDVLIFLNKGEKK